MSPKSLVYEETWHCRTLPASLDPAGLYCVQRATNKEKVLPGCSELRERIDSGFIGQDTSRLCVLPPRILT